MLNTLSPLESCVAPLTVEEFVQNYWEKLPLFNLGANGREYFSDLVSMKTVDNIISCSNLRAPFLRIFRSGEQLSAEQIMSKWLSGADSSGVLADLNVVYEQYDSGATVELCSVERSWRPLGEFCSRLEKQLECPVQAHIYLAPKKASSFTSKTGAHSVFIIQTDGISCLKIWQEQSSMFQAGYANSALSNSAQTKSNQNSPLYEVTLRSSDVVYLPRGYIYEVATADDSHSLRICINVEVQRYIDVLFALTEKALAACQQDLRYRMGLPVNCLLSENSMSPGAAQVFNELITDFMVSLRFDHGQQLVREKFLTSRKPSICGRLLDQEKLDQVNLETRVFKRPEVTSVIEEKTENVLISSRGNTETFNVRFLEALRFTTCVDSFQVAEIPGDITNDERVTFVKQLISSGHLTLQPKSSGFSSQIG